MLARKLLSVKFFPLSRQHPVKGINVPIIQMRKTRLRGAGVLSGKVQSHPETPHFLLQVCGSDQNTIITRIRGLKCSRGSPGPHLSLGIHSPLRGFQISQLGGLWVGWHVSDLGVCMIRLLCLEKSPVRAQDPVGGLDTFARLSQEPTTSPSSAHPSLAAGSVSTAVMRCWLSVLLLRAARILGLLLHSSTVDNVCHLFLGHSGSYGAVQSTSERD